MYNPADENEYDDLFINKLVFNMGLDSTKSSDIGYNKIFKMVSRSINDKQLVKKKGRILYDRWCWVKYKRC